MTAALAASPALTALDRCDRPRPEDAYSAKFSLQHCVAAALADGRVDQASFGEASRRRLARGRTTGPLCHRAG